MAREVSPCVLQFFSSAQQQNGSLRSRITYPGLPNPGQGHLLPLLDLTHQLALRNLNISILPTLLSLLVLKIRANEIRSWLDQFEDETVLYVWFGSEAMLTTKQMQMLALALENSGVHFLWSYKDPTKDT
ncbi:hypothetical protein ACET3Z_014010 [Daucus carota]